MTSAGTPQHVPGLDPVEGNLQIDFTADDLTEHEPPNNLNLPRQAARVTGSDLANAPGMEDGPSLLDFEPRATMVVQDPKTPPLRTTADSAPAWSARTVYLTPNGGVIPLARTDTRRRSITLQIPSGQTGTLYVSEDANNMGAAAAYNAIPMHPTQGVTSITLSCRGDVFATADVGNANTVVVFVTITRN